MNASDVTTLGAELDRLSLTDRVAVGEYFETDRTQEVQRASYVLCSKRDVDRGHMFVHLGGGQSLYSWTWVARTKDGTPYRLQGGVAVVVVPDGSGSKLKLVKYA